MPPRRSTTGAYDVQLIRTRLLNALGASNRIIGLETLIATLMIGQDSLDFGLEGLAEMLGYDNRRSVQRALDESREWQLRANIRICDVVRGTRNVRRLHHFSSNRLNSAGLSILKRLERDADNETPALVQIDQLVESAIQKYLRLPLKTARQAQSKGIKPAPQQQPQSQGGSVISWDIFGKLPEPLSAERVRLFPVEKKVPRVWNWRQCANRNPEVISVWLNRWPGTDWGIPCGTALAGGGYLVGLDKDRHGEKFGDGFKTVALRERELGELPATFTVATSGGGEHCYFRSTIPLPTWSGTLGPGLDCKGKGGFVVAPVISAGYTVTHALGIADLPASWQDGLNIVARPKQKTPIGERHAYLRKVAYAMACEGKTLDQILATLNERLRFNCEQGGREITERELRELAVSALASIARADQRLNTIFA